MEENEEEGLRILEIGLRSEILELKSQIEENDLVYGIPSKGMSSIHLPKDSEHFKRLRKMTIQRTLQVADERPLKIQADMMKREMDSCDRLEYTHKSVPLLIHQYFLDRIQEMIVSKHAHLLRWKRYCITSNVVESIYPEYKERLQHIMDEYLDANARANRLVSARDGFITRTDDGVDDLTTDDMMIYLRWLICHLHSLKYFVQINRIIQWFPIAHRKELVKVTEIRIEDIIEEMRSSKMSYVDAPTTFTEQAPMPPAMVAATFVSCKPLRPTMFNLELAAAAGGMITDVKNLQLPHHCRDLASLRAHLIVYCNMYDIDMDVVKIKSSADEMELFSFVNRKFKIHFNLQEQMKTLVAYDAESTENGTKNVLKVANWLPYVKLKPKTNLSMVKALTKLRAENRVDDLLKVAAKFVSLTDHAKVQGALRQQANLVKEPPVVHSAPVISHRHGINISDIFRKIYTNPELYNTTVNGNNMDDSHDKYEFNQNEPIPGFGDSNQTMEDPASLQGAYLSYLHLRHLRIRDLQRTCLSILNYFRSLERTLTINDQGLSLDGWVGDRSYQNHRSGVSLSGHQGGGGNIGSQSYLFNTPREARISENEFMHFAEIENHDDFYHYEDGRIHVRDQKGYWITYDVAVTDFEELERDLMLIASVFIFRYKNGKKKPLYARMSTKEEESTITDQPPRQEIDRFSVLYDLWSNHASFLESQKKLVDLYMEVYHNTFNRDERRRVAQSLTNVMYRSPMIDFEEDYLVATYRLESAIMRLQETMYQKIIDNQIDKQRQYIKMIGENVHDFGLPLPVTEKLLIYCSADQSSLKKIFMLEFHESLSIVAHITESVEWCFKDILYNCKPTKVIQEIIIEKKMYEIMLLELDAMANLGVSYTPQAQRDLFADFFIENPIMITQLADEYLQNVATRNTEGDKRSRKVKLVNEFCRLYELVTLRFRLLDATWESEILAKIYQRQSGDLGYDDFHLYLRPIQFEAAKHKEGADHARPPMRVSSIQDDDTALDKFTPSALPLAINEIDEIGVGKFSFKGRPNVIEMLETKGVENMMVVLKVQLSHKNALASAVSISEVCRPSIYLSNETEEDLSIPNFSEAKSDMTANTGNLTNVSVPLSLHTSLSVAPPDTKKLNSLKFKDIYPEAFFSIQLEKTPSRDRAMNKYVKKCGGNSKMTSADIEGTKRELIVDYVNDFSHRIQQTSLRAQIIAYYNSIIHILRLVPSVAEKWFQFGKISEKKADIEEKVDNEDIDVTLLNPKVYSLLSESGENFLNLWFIPHFTEVLFLYRDMVDEKATENLQNYVRIIGNFHDILHFLVGFSRLQISSAKISTELKAQNLEDFEANKSTLSSQFVFQMSENDVDGIEINKPQDYDGGVLSQLSTELNEINQQISNLKDHTNIQLVIELLSARRDITFLKFDYCISHVLLDTFLSTGNQGAYTAMKANIKFPLEEMTNVQRSTTMMVKFDVPEPMEARDEWAEELYPYRSLMNKNGPFLIMHDSWKNIQENIQLCLAGLTDVDRPTVHGEIVSLNLCLEDVLVDGILPEAKSGEKLPINEFENILMLGKKFHKRDKQNLTNLSSVSEVEKTQGSNEEKNNEVLNIITNPVECYNLMKQFIILSKRLDILKYNWGARKLALEAINTPRDFKMFSKIYKTEKLYPLMKSLCIQYRLQEVAVQGQPGDSDIFVTPKGLPEMVVKQRQLGKMIETLEGVFIGDLRKRIIRQTDQVLKERNREEGNLPLDLWKKPAMKEAISVKRPAIAEDFLHELMNDTDLQNDDIKKSETLTFDREHLSRCLQGLNVSVLQMHRESYENYAMYYENQLKHQHQLLYYREREIEEMNQQLKQKELATMVDVQFQMADQAHSLLLEVNALRAKVAEMKEESLQQEQSVRDEVRQEYNNMVQNLFSVAFEQKNQIDVYREYLHEATIKRIQEVRTEAAIEMNKVKEKSGAKVTADDELAERNLKLSKELTSLHKENIHMKQMMSRMKSLFNWHHTFIKCNFQKSIATIEKSRDQYKNCVTIIKMNSEERIHVMDEELARLKDYLTGTEKDLNDLRKTLEKEMKEKLDKKHATERKAATDKQMSIVKQMHIDQLMSEITEKNCNISTMSKVLNENMKSHKSVADKSVREVDTLKKSLRGERKLKQSAFSKVDDLMSQVYEFESAFSLVRGGAAAAASTAKPSDSISCSPSGRPQTGNGSKAGPLHPVCTDRRMTTAKSKPRPLTFGDILRRYPIPYAPQQDTSGNFDRVGCLQLRKRIADQLLMSLEPEDHDQLARRAAGTR